MRTRQWFRTLALATALATGGAGCYGSFVATKALHTWNGEISENEFVHTAMLWVFVIFPVYELFMLGDAIIFNVIEFWTGENPLAANADPEQSKSQRLAGVDLTQAADGTVSIAHNGRELVVRPVDGASFDVFIDGERVGTGRTMAEGGIVLFDAEGGIVRTLFNAELEEVEQVLLGGTGLAASVSAAKSVAAVNVR